MRRQTSRVVLRATLAAALVAALAAITATGSPGAPAAKRDTLVIALQELGTTIDPRTYQAASMTLLQATLEPLVYYGMRTVKGYSVPVFDPQTFTPGAARSWVIDPKQRFMTMTLRRGVKSPYGNELTTADIKWTVERSIATKSFGGAYMFAQANIDPANPITVIDKYRFRWNLKGLSPNLLRGIAFHWESPFDSTEAKKHATEQDPWAQEWLATNSASFGPYHVTQFTPGQSATLEANPNYYGGAPPIKRIVMRAVPDPGNRQQLLQSGAVQYAPDIPRVQLAQLAKNKNVKVEYGRSTRMLYLLMNTKMKPWDNRTLRQAVAYAIPYEQINKQVYKGTATLASGPVSPLFTRYHDPKTWKYKYDPAKAKELLQKSGVGAVNATLQYSLSNPGPETAQVAIIVRNALKAIGLEVQLDQATSDAAYFAGLIAKKVPFGFGGTAPFIADAGFQLFNTGPGGSGFADYTDPQFVAQAVAANRVIEPKSRYRAIHRAQVYWNRDVPEVPILEPNYGVAMHPDLFGFNVQHTGFPLLKLFRWTA